MIGIERDEFVGEGELAHIPQLRIVPVGETDGLRQSGHVEQHIARAENILGQLAVDAVDQVSQRARKRAVQTAKKRFRRRSESLKDANGIRIGLDAVAQRLQVADHALHGGG